ncbi:MAG: hypothetical protein KAJ07_08855 [Planctomycetes bacterium]|nr:hypothetical protein [Planctomycetota bacterium]
MCRIRKANPNKTAVLALILLCVFGTSVCFGQSADANVRLQTKVTYSCENLPMEVVLKELAQQAGVFIVKSPQVTGDVTIEVVDVPLEELLTNVLGAYNYTYIATKNMIRVVPLSEAVVLRETLITQIYKITYADAGEVTLALGDFLSLNGKVSFNKGTSHIIVTDTEDKIKAIGKFIEEIDKATPQVIVEVRIYDITSEEAFEIEAEWDAMSNEHTVTTEREEITSHRVGVDPKDLSEEIHGDEWNNSGFYVVDDATTDDTAHQGLIEIPGSVKQFPATDPYDINSDTTTKTYTKERRKPKFGASFDKKKGGTIRISLLDNAIELDFALSMLHSTVEAKLLASPRVMVLDNETATFETVREVPYTERTTSGGEVLSSTMFKPVGVQLEVTPHIARDGMVRLKVKPEFGVVVDIDENGAPTIETRRTETTTLIRSGQTIVLAGLRKKEIKKGIDKMPLFGDLPLIGGLFRAESEEEVTSELVVFITTKIITEPGLTETESKQYSATNFGMPKISDNTWLEGDRRRSKASIARDKARKASARAKAAVKAKAAAAAKAQTVNARNYGKDVSASESTVETRVEIVEAEAPRYEKYLEPIEAEPVNSADFIRQWMRRTQK